MTDLAPEIGVRGEGSVRGAWIAITRRRYGGLALTVGLAAASGIVTSQVMPHGPATAVEALVVMATGALMGLCAGASMRSRWGFVWPILAYAASVELGRIGAAGPTVDLPRLDNVFGIIALILGRGFHTLLAFVPLLFGFAMGRSLFRHLPATSHQRKRIWRQLPAWILALMVIALVVLVAIPASTPPIVDDSGIPVAGSIAQLETVRIGGHEQAILVRAYDANKPVLLYLSGGPGQSSLPWPRVLFEELTRDFVLVAWDQRGAGKSYAALDPTATLTLEQMIADTVELTNYLRQRFDERKIYLLGESWGTTLAVLAAQRQPQLYHAIIGSGQMVSQRETDRRLYYDVLDFAARTGNQTLAARMQAFGEPPYKDLYGYVFVMGYYEALYKPYALPPTYVQKGTQANLGPWNVMGSEYNFVEKINVFRGFLDTAAVLYPQLQEIDFRRDVPRLETALYILDGAAELDARRELALEWYALVEAPIKRLYTFENAAHATAFEQFEAFQEIMTTTVLAETYRTE